MNVARLLLDSPSDDTNRRRPTQQQQPPPPSSTSDASIEASSERVERGERGSGGQYGSGGSGPYDGTRVQSQNQSTWPLPYTSRPGPSSAPSTPISTHIPYPTKDGPPSSTPWSHPQQPPGNPYPPTSSQLSPSIPYDPPPPTTNTTTTTSTATTTTTTRIRAGSNAAVHPPTTGPGVPPPLGPGSSYMPPHDYPHPTHHHKSSQPQSTVSTPHYSTPVPGQPRLAMSHSPPAPAGSPYASGVGPPPPPSGSAPTTSSSTPRRGQSSQLATPQPPHAHGPPPSSHPSPAMASLQNPALPSGGAWGPGVPGPPLVVDGRERELRDRTHPALTAERERPGDRDRDMNPAVRDRDRDWDREQSRRKQLPPPTGPGVPPPPPPPTTLAGPGTGAPPPLGPGVPPVIGAPIPDDLHHKISATSAPGSNVPSRTHSRSQNVRDDLIDHPKSMERASRMPERDMPGRTPDYAREYPPYRREPGEVVGSSTRREREEYLGPGGPSSSSGGGGGSRLPPPPPPPPGPPGDYRSSEYRREPPPPPPSSSSEYRRESGEYRQHVDYRREQPHPHSSGDHRREPLPGDYRREPPPPPVAAAEYRAREGGPGEYRREPPPPSGYRDYGRGPPPPVDYRREPPPGEYRREPTDYRQPGDYRRDLPPPPSQSHSPESYRRELPEYRRERDPQDYHPSSSRRNSDEHRRERDRERSEREYMEREQRDSMRDREREHSIIREREREADLRRAGELGSGSVIQPPPPPPSSSSQSERQVHRSPHQMREIDPRRTNAGDYSRREAPPPPVQHSPHEYRSGPPPPPPPPSDGGYRSDYRPPPGEYRREPPPPPPSSQEYVSSRREQHHSQHPQDYRRDEYPRQPPSHSHAPPPPPPGHAPPPMHSGQDYRGPPGEYRGGPPGSGYGREGPPPPQQPPPPPGPPQDYRREVHPSEYRGGPPGSSLPPPPGDYSRQGPPPGQEYRGREPGEIIPGAPSRDYPTRRERERERERGEHPREAGDYSRPPPGLAGPPPGGEYPRRRDEGGEYIGHSSQQQPGSMPPGPGIPGRPVSPSSAEMYIVKQQQQQQHPADRERDRERERWEREQQRERGHYPPSQPPSGSGGGGSGGPSPPVPGSVPPGHHPGHSHSHSKHHHHPHYSSHSRHPRSMHPSHPYPPHGAGAGGGPQGGGPPPSAGPPPGSSGQAGQGPPISQDGSGAPPLPSQRQLQTQFSTRFVSVVPQPGSRMTSPAPGPPGGSAMGSSSAVGGGGRKDMGGSSGGAGVVGKDGKKMRSSGPPLPPGSGSIRRERDERDKERDIHASYPPQSGPHRDGQGRVLGHGYPPHSHGPHAVHGQPYDDYMVVDEMNQQQQQQQQQAQMQSQVHPHSHPGHPQPLPPHRVHHHQQQQQQPPVLQHPHSLPQFYPAPQEGVEELWPQEQPDREVKARHKINLGTFVYPNTPFPYFFDVGEWVGVHGKEQKTSASVAAAAVVGAVKEGEREVEEKEKATAEKKDVDMKEQDKEVKEKEEVGDQEKDKEKEKDREDVAAPGQVAEKTADQTTEEDDMIDVETQATILIPNGFIPREKPPKPRIWGGGVIGRPVPQRRIPSSANEEKSDSPERPKKRRIYTDDSDLFLCAMHSGWLTWSASARARDQGKDLRMEVRIIRCAGAGAGSVYAVGAGAFAGKYAPAVNGAVVTNGALHKKNGSDKVPVVRKEEIVGRFIGGWGEKCFVKELNGETGDDTEDDEDNDGRGLVSAGWGGGHDGSAIEVIKVEFVEKGAARKAPGVGRRNRSQRLLEYSERRAAVLGLQRIPQPARVAGRKRRRNWDPWPPARRLPNATVLDIIPELQEDELTEDERPETPIEPERTEEDALMSVRTVVFDIGLAGDTRLGYKYQPQLLKDILFPPLSSQPSDRPPARKRRRTTFGSEDILMDADPTESEPLSPAPNRPVILETPKESYLLSLTHGSEFSLDGRKYDISLILQGEVEEEREDAVVLVVADMNATKSSQDVPPPTPPADEPAEPKPEPVPSSDVTMADAEVPAKASEEETQNKADSSTQDPPASSSSGPPSPSTTVPQTDTQPTNSEPSALGATGTTVESANTLATPPPQSSEDVSMADAKGHQGGTPAPKAEKSESTAKPPQKTPFKHPVAQVLQRRVGEDMFRFTGEGISIADGEDSMRTEWLVQVRSWKWATRKIVRV